MNFKEKYNEYLNFFNSYLDTYFNSLTEIPSELKSAMEYAVKDGGKRVRPVLCLSVADMLGISKDKVINYALAIELIHSYSLVHDDLPSMDNDDYRRGKLSTHKKFGEALGVLTGDALLNQAFEVLFNVSYFNINDLSACRTVAEYAGSVGMIKGQVLDVDGENADSFTEKQLYDIVLNKTSKLITAPILVPSILSGNRYYSVLKEYGFTLGLLFQTTDDIFDVEGDIKSIGKTPHKDENKITAIKIYGLDGAKQKAKEYYLKCKNLIKDIENNEFLSDFTDYIYSRKK